MRVFVTKYLEETFFVKAHKSETNVLGKKKKISLLGKPSFKKTKNCEREKNHKSYLMQVVQNIFWRPFYRCVKFSCLFCYVTYVMNSSWLPILSHADILCCFRHYKYELSCFVTPYYGRFIPFQKGLLKFLNSDI